MWHRLLDLLLPLCCAGCETPVQSALFCAACTATLHPGDGDCCPRCGDIRLDPPAGGGTHTCGRCLAEPPPFSRARGAYAYGGALREVVTAWKNAPDHTLGPPLARLMVRRAAATGWAELARDTLVVPVPSAAARLRARGFNPAGVLASGLARALGLPLEPLGLGVGRAVAPTRGLGWRARQRRLAGVYVGEAERVGGRAVLLVDDVMTTGTTARAASRALLRAGAASVEVAALARTPRD
ncbi:MAG: ComF family protein [Deltaproteobacteria bacterium]|nr:ComF family protein [Deltaproteobacteria bacterium]